MRRGIDKSKQSTCTACPAEKCVGGETFRCHACGKERDMCAEKVGATNECVHCFEWRVFGPQWVEGWDRREGRSLHNADRLVKAAIVYQNTQLARTAARGKKEG